MKSKPLLILKIRSFYLMSCPYYAPWSFILRGKVYFYRFSKTKISEWFGNSAWNFAPIKKAYETFWLI